MATFAVRVEYEQDVEADQEALSQLVGFCVRRVLMECERRDFPPIGSLTVEKRRVDTSGQFRAQPVILHYTVEDHVQEGWRRASVALRTALGIPHPELLEA